MQNNIGNLTFASLEELKKSEIIKKRGWDAKISDSAILSGGFYNNKGNGLYWLRNISDVGDGFNYGINRNSYHPTKKGYAPDLVGTNKSSTEYYRHDESLRTVSGGRVLLPFKPGKIPTNNGECFKAEDGIYEVYFGNYSRNLVSEDKQIILENLFKNKELEKNNSYKSLGDSVYNFDRKVYIRKLVEDTVTLSDGNKYYSPYTDYKEQITRSWWLGRETWVEKKIPLETHYTYVWIMVEPVKWLVDPKQNFMITDEIIFAGITFCGTYYTPYTGHIENSHIYKFMNGVLKYDLFNGIKEPKYVSLSNRLNETTESSIYFNIPMQSAEPNHYLVTPNQIEEKTIYISPDKKDEAERQVKARMDRLENGLLAHEGDTNGGK